MTEERTNIPVLARSGHSGHCTRCLTGIPFSLVTIESSKLPFIFYCLGSLDLLNTLGTATKESERESWRNDIWGLQASGIWGSGFKPSWYMTSHDAGDDPQRLNKYESEFDTPHMIITYTALVTLAILRDDFTRLDRPGLVTFLRSSQREDGSFTSDPTGGDTDLRLTYCAFVVSTLLNDWSGVNVEKALEFVRRCRTYEGGYGSAPGCEAQGGPTYLAIAILRLASDSPEYLSESERRQTLRWLLQNQDESGGFRGRTNKDADACYCFWCGGAIQILGATELVDATALALFLGNCQFRFGGIAKAPGEHADPYHTYLSLAAIAMFPPSESVEGSTWAIEPLDPVINAKLSTAQWARDHIPLRST
ncbi:terpenoid cyclases/Protein prenyltransferase [Thelephora ganbajun]|uniref:Terpenoid cyclases/Protein prenyltransferase n=1 Tax=Thelephora ganbajun TaxID=370292 RepID=A0ACB6ZJK3_THEGA|nr:terpenoid cyclases/Protein prenyltransferase [Thelephora ganbajun]